MSEHPWQEMGRCTSCGHIIQKDVGWLDNFFVPVCPSCGTYNSNYLFEAITARRVTNWWGKTLRIEVKGEEQA